MKINRIPQKPPKSIARFDSDCEGCGNEIIEGDEIFLIESEWVCIDCAWEDEKNG